MGYIGSHMENRRTSEVVALYNRHRSPPPAEFASLRSLTVVVVADTPYIASAVIDSLPMELPDPPPLKWSDLRYVFDIKEDCNGKEAIQA